MKLTGIVPRYYAYCFALVILLSATGCDSGLNHIKKIPPSANHVHDSIVTGDALEQGLTYEILVAEFFGQRGAIDQALQHYLSLAQTSRDPAIIERAVHVALYANDDDIASNLAYLWLEVSKDNQDAIKVLLLTAVRQGQIHSALVHVQKLMQIYQVSLVQGLWLIGNILSDNVKPDQLTLLLESLIADHLHEPEVLYATAQIAIRYHAYASARLWLEKLLRLDADNKEAVITYVNLLKNQGDITGATRWLEEYLQQKRDFDLRLYYGQLLVQAEQLEKAKHVFLGLNQQEPRNPDVIYVLGLLYLDIGEIEQAKHQFADLNGFNKYQAKANYYLGRIAETQKQWQEATTYYQQVDHSEHYIDARLRLGFALSYQNNVNEALKVFHDLKTRSDIDQVLLIQAETEILLHAGHYEDAMVLLNDVLLQQPHPDPNLLYARASVAEKLGKLGIMESDLKLILESDPDHIVALNALGYTLADRTDRHHEALQYIERAYELEPDNFYILDSMGWVMYRLGYFDEAIYFLQRALAKQNDPEIAAHLGEVLWSIGDKIAAQEVLNRALEHNPEDAQLLKVMEKFYN